MLFIKYYLVLLCFLSFELLSQNPYHVDSIPSTLKENVDAVIRLDKTEFKIKDKGKAVLSTHYVVTIFNERGTDDQLRYYTYYYKLNKVLDISGKVYDKNGERIYKLSKKDIYDVSASARSNDVTDNRIKIAEFDNKNFQFPYTIEFESSVETTNMMFYPSAYFHPSERLSTQEKTLIIETPDDFEFRYKEKKMPNKVNLVTEKNKKIYTWTIKNILASEYEIHTPDDFYPEIITAPKVFSVEDYEGNIESWNDIGKFISKLYQGRDVLPDAIKLKVANLVSQEKDTLKKIELLYQFLQNNTRYMSIQLGIGGWQTMTATHVALTGYGDCKALSNYMKALLKEAGITSYLALISAGADEEDVDPMFPSMRFNHVINCVPLKNDTIWLECTSQTNAFGFMGSFTGNRKALVILPDGAALVNTIKYHAIDNSKITKATIVLDNANNATAQLKTSYSGITKEHKDYLLQEKNEEQLKKMLQYLIHIPSFDLNQFTLQESKSKIPSLQVSLNVNIKNIGSKTGSLFFMKPNLLNNQEFSIVDKKQRKYDFHLNPNGFEKEEIDSLSFQIPQNLIPDKLPEPVSIKTPFGEYISSVTFKDGDLCYYRKLIQYSGYFAAKDYEAYKSFCKSVNKYDNQQIAFKIMSN
jgi:hypothetical protein